MHRRYREVLDAPGGVPDAALSADGRVLFGMKTVSPPHQPATEHIAAYDAATGALLRRMWVVPVCPVDAPLGAAW